MKKFKLKKGYALYVSIILTSLVFVIAYSVTNVSTRQLILSNIATESHYSFYNADTGVECAMYWDLKNPSISAFATTTAGTVNCNAQTITTGSQTVQTNPTQSSMIGGGGAANPVSIFQLNFTKGCVIVTVTKNPNNTTKIDSRGYNNCSSGKRYERGVTIEY